MVTCQRSRPGGRPRNLPIENERKFFGFFDAFGAFGGPKAPKNAKKPKKIRAIFPDAFVYTPALYPQREIDSKSIYSALDEDVIMSLEEAEYDDGPLASCELCGHSNAHKHRIVPGEWGGSYDDENVAWLCPNHHAAVHFLMARYLDGVRRPAVRSKTAIDDGRFMALAADRPLQKFWAIYVKPIVIEKLRSEGRWYPYVIGEFDPVLALARINQRLVERN